MPFRSVNCDVFNAFMMMENHRQVVLFLYRFTWELGLIILAFFKFSELPLLAMWDSCFSVSVSVKYSECDTL